MTSKLTSGHFKIISAIRDSPININDINPLVLQVVRLGSRGSIWEVSEKGGGIYQFAVENVYPYSGEWEAKVIATTDQLRSVSWRVTYRANSDAFTIEYGNVPGKVWTIADKTDPKSEIVIQDIKYLTPLTEPPTVSPTQLFKFV